MNDSAIRAASLGRLTNSEISAQPESWLRAAALATERPAGLPMRGERVLVLGCGTSFYVAGAYAWLREQAGLGVTDAVIASELPPHVRDYDRIIAISRSGTTTEVALALGALPAGIPVTVILGELDTPIQKLATDVIDLTFADDRSVVQTRFPTTALTLLRAHLGLSAPSLAVIVEECEAVLDAPLDEAAPRQLVLLASGWSRALAEEAALKCRESAGMWTESYATGEFRHGPISVAGEGTLVWAMTPLTEVQVDAIRETGATIHFGTNDPQVELVAVQRYAVEWAAQSGRDADLPVHLSRSVVAL